MRSFVLLSIAAAATICPCLGQRFTVADDIGMSYFGDPFNADSVDAINFSPDGRYFVVNTQRGLLATNRPESTLRIYSTQSILHFLAQPKNGDRPIPALLLRKSESKDGPNIKRVRWLANSKGVAFLSTNALGNNQLFLISLKTKRVYTLTPAKQHVEAFDIHDQDSFVYVAQDVSEGIVSNSESILSKPVVVTGRSLLELAFPSSMRRSYDRGTLWTVVNGNRHQVKNRVSGDPIVVYAQGQHALTLSPDGKAVITAQPLDSVPTEWETQYRPPESSLSYQIRAGVQNLQSPIGYSYVSEYSVVDLSSGKVEGSTQAPTGNSVGWWGGGGPAAWSRNSRSVVLPNSFQSSTPEGSGPCVSVFDLPTRKQQCVKKLEHTNDDGYDLIDKVQFDSGNAEKLVIDLHSPTNGSRQTIAYARTIGGSWEIDSTHTERHPTTRPLSVIVKQGLNVPPVLVATDNRSMVSKTILDPNPQLNGIQLGEASVYSWNDKNGRHWVGTLFKPPDYEVGRRYPVVIQTHGLFGDQFLPSGTFPTAFAARELAAREILVLQLIDCPYTSNPTEASCNVAGYEAGIHQLVSDGLADERRIGIIGFSRTCFFVLKALTASALSFKAASVTDGVNEGYFQYIVNVDLLSNRLAHEADSIIGASPFGTGFEAWRQHSPVFNLEKTTTPLQVVALGGTPGLLTMWEPYAILRYLGKPVDFILLSQGSHVLTNPSERRISQEGTVDWFDFWLNDREDPNPDKVDQYARWHALRIMHGASAIRVTGTENTSEAKPRNMW